ncbi:MAG: PucC family protein, partial [Pseudomonadota bacterium]
RPISWGSVQASAAGLGIAAGGLIRDALHASSLAAGAPEAPYLPVFALEILFLAFALLVALPLLRRSAGRGRAPTYVAE